MLIDRLTAQRCPWAWRLRLAARASTGLRPGPGLPRHVLERTMLAATGSRMKHSFRNELNRSPFLSCTRRKRS